MYLHFPYLRFPYVRFPSLRNALFRTCLFHTCVFQYLRFQRPRRYSMPRLLAEQYHETVWCRFAAVGPATDCCSSGVRRVNPNNHVLHWGTLASRGVYNGSICVVAAMLPVDTIILYQLVYEFMISIADQFNQLFSDS